MPNILKGAIGTAAFGVIGAMFINWDVNLLSMLAQLSSGERAFLLFVAPTICFVGGALYAAVVELQP